MLLGRYSVKAGYHRREKFHFHKRKTEEMKKLFSRYQWHMIATVIIASCVFFAVSVLVPNGVKQLEALKQIKKDLSLAARAEHFPYRIVRIRSNMEAIDSLLKVVEQKDRFTPAQALDLVYSLADSSECKTEKVQIDDPIPAVSGKEIPVTYIGRGTYHAIGRFVQGIENMQYATRIRQAVLRKTEGDLGELVLDFIIMEK